MKKNHMRVTYTLIKTDIEIIEHYSKMCGLSKSKLVSLCIENCFLLMEELSEERKNGIIDTVYPYGKKFKYTQPITLTLPQNVVEKLNNYSSELSIKKSHLVGVGVTYLNQQINQKADKNIEMLMDSVK